MKKIKNKIDFSLDLKTYPLEAIYLATYLFLDRFYIFLDSPSPQKIKVSLKKKNGVSVGKGEDIRGEFSNELLNATLRLKIAKLNKKVREAIIGQALLSSLGEVTAKENEDSFQEDPLGIATPWEEKYGKKKK